jgi:NADH dehydrogenase [ubiquinone] 1 alpha subcomplex assembly factor 5
VRDIVPLPWAVRPGAVPGDDCPAIPLPDGSVDLVMSSLSLHWVNNIPGLLGEVMRVLRPDGVFLGSLLGGETLAELRSAWVAAESERDGGVSPHVSPMMGVADAGNLLSAAGFGIPTVDSDVFTIEYPSPVAVMEHLQAMGEASAALGARPGARPGTVLAAAAAYQAMYGNNTPGSGDGSVPATFEVVYMIGWKPAPSQPSPLPRGSVPKGFAARVVEPPAAGGSGAAAGGSGSTPASPLR